MSRPGELGSNGSPLTSPGVRRVRLLLFLVFAALALAACRVDSTVRVDVAEDGSGTVTVTVRLDREAAQRLGDPTSAVRLDDLRAAGWTVEDPRTDADSGELTYRGRREFASPEDLPRVLAEVGGTGDTAVFSDVRLAVANAFASTSYDFSSKVTLTGSLEQFSDPDLSAALGGLPLARTPEELAAEGAAADGAAQLRIEVVLPGSPKDTNAPSTGDGGVATWQFPLSGGTPTDATITSSSATSQSAPLVLLLVGGGLVVLAIAAAVVGLVRRRG